MLQKTSFQKETGDICGRIAPLKQEMVCKYAYTCVFWSELSAYTKYRLSPKRWFAYEHWNNDLILLCFALKKKNNWYWPKNELGMTSAKKIMQ